MDTLDPKTIAQIRTKTRRVWPVAQFIATSSAEVFPTAGRPDGTMIISKEDAVDR